VKRLAVVLAVGAAVGAILGGCARAPAPGVAVAPAELREFVASLEAPWDGVDALRGSGDAEITVSGRTLRSDFAIAYSRDGWARFDLRPRLGSLGTSLTALGMVEGDCARAYFPARVIEIHGCFSDLVAVGPPDLAPLLVGAVDPEFLLGLGSPTLAVSGDLSTLRGEIAGLPVRVETESGLLTELELTGSDGATMLLVSYARPGESGEPGPSRVVVEVESDSGETARAVLRYARLRRSEPLARDDYAPAIPPGARSLHWRELAL